MKSLETSNFLPYFYKNPLSKDQLKFLTKSDHRGLSNPSQTRKVITDKLVKSFKWIYHILDNKNNLKPDEVNKIFNALYLQGFFQNLLVDSRESYLQDFSYDFRTTEVARLMFELSTKYLLSSKQFVEDDYVKENVERLSKSFMVLSTSALLKEDPGETISLDKQIEIDEKIWKILNPKDDEQGYVDPADWDATLPIRQVYESILQHLVTLNLEYEDLKNNKKEKQMNENRKKYNLEKEHWNSLKEWFQEQNKVHEQVFGLRTLLNHKYDHISTYFCRINSLKDAPALPENIAEFQRKRMPMESLPQL